jgi:hypothetical protein
MNENEKLIQEDLKVKKQMIQDISKLKDQFILSAVSLHIQYPNDKDFGEYMRREVTHYVDTFVNDITSRLENNQTKNK